MSNVAKRRGSTLETLLDRRFDFPVGVPLTQVYFVASVPRSGSHLLCNHLWNTGVMGAPLEYLNLNQLPTLFGRFGVRYLDEYVIELVRHRTSPNGVFGLKLGREQLAFLQLFPFNHPLKSGKWIFIDRHDKHRQAISFYIANQTSAWSSLAETRREPVYSFEGIARCLETVLVKSHSWSEYFKAKQIEPVRIAYEDLAADPAAQVRHVQDRLGIPLQPGFSVTLPSLERQSVSRNDEWLERFRADLASAGPA